MRFELLDRPALAKLQKERLDKLLDEVWRSNPFYQEKFAAAGLSSHLAPRDEGLRLAERDGYDLTRLPFTTKTELLEDQIKHPPYGRNLTYPRDRYVRMHQTSGTSGGRPMRWLDTAESWSWMLGCKEMIYRIAGIEPSDRLFFPFSFGPFLGFWAAFEAGTRRGCLCLPGGGLSSLARLHMLQENQVTVVLCTPTYGLRLAEVAKENGIDLTKSGVRALIVAGEPGGSVPSIRDRLEKAWNARVFDHSGMTEVGPMAIECRDNPGGLHILESEYFVEVFDPATGEETPPGQVGELIVTNLGRLGSPVIRYRTGDLVRIDPEPCPCGRALCRLKGGILSRTDDMIQIRGNNLYPSALENVIRRFDEVAEYRIEIDRTASMPVVRIELEPSSKTAGKGLAEKVQHRIRDELLVPARVTTVAPGTLPRYEMKGRRIVHKE